MTRARPAARAWRPVPGQPGLLRELLHVDAADLGQLVPEGGELGAPGHVVGQFLQRDLPAVGGQLQGAQAQHAEVVADHEGVVRVVGDEDDAEAAVAGGGDVLQDHAGLFDAEGGGRLVEDEDAGAEVDGAGDRDALALPAGEGADGLLQVVQDDAHVAQFLVRGLLHAGDVEAPERPGAFGQLGPEEEVPPHGHQRDGGEVLVDGGDAAVQGLARGGEADRFAVDEELALGVLVQPGDDLDEGGLAGAVVAEHAGHPSGVDGEVDAVQGADGAVGLAGAAQFDEGRSPGVPDIAITSWPPCCGPTD